MSSSPAIADPNDKSKRGTPPIASSVPRTGPCQSCSDMKQTCVSRGTPGGRCYQCVIARITCKPLERSPATSRTLREHEVETEDKESVADSLLMTSPNFRGVSSPTPRGATSRKTSSTSTELTSSHDGRESRALRRTSKQPGRRAPLAMGASFSIDAIQVAAATSLVEDKILEPSELVELYHLFMTRWNPCVLVLDPNVHTLQYLAKSRLLLAVVSAVASQDYPAHPGLYGPLMIYARRIAADEIFSQSHEVERVQAFLLLSLFPDWNLPLEQNRSWLDLGLALDLAKRMNIDQKVATYEQSDASPADRNVFRTWMICHNLDIIATLQFDKPASLPGSTSPRRRVWPENTGDGSLESAVETLTVPLEHISFHLRQHSFQRYNVGADLVPGIRSGEHVTSTFIVDQGVVDAMADATQRVKASPSTANGSALQRFWIHMADISTKYSRLLLLTRYSSMHKVIQDSDLHSRLLDAASAILQSYIDTAADFDCSKYAPGCFFAYGVLAAGVVSKLSDGNDNIRVTSLLDPFLTILQQSPAVARNGNMQGPFVRLTAQFRAGGMSEPGPGNVPMSTSGFPAWWKQYL